MNVRGEGGIALVVILITMLLLSALGAALVLLTTSETLTAANFRVANEAFYAADGAFERAFSELRGEPDWDGVLQGAVTSSFADGAPGGVRSLADGSAIDLGQIVNLSNCGKRTACTSAEMDAKTASRPWGVNNPRWKPYAYGPLSEIASGSTNASRFYVVALVGDDGSENDGDPAHDGISVSGVLNPGQGVLSLRAEAFGPRGAHKTIEATIARYGTAEAGGGTSDVRVLAWRELR